MGKPALSLRHIPPSLEPAVIGGRSQLGRWVRNGVFQPRSNPCPTAQGDEVLVLIALGFFSRVLTPGFVLLPAFTVSPSTAAVQGEIRRSPLGIHRTRPDRSGKSQGPIASTIDMITVGYSSRAECAVTADYAPDIEGLFPTSFSSKPVSAVSNQLIADLIRHGIVTNPVVSGFSAGVQLVRHGHSHVGNQPTITSITQSLGFLVPTCPRVWQTPETGRSSAVFAPGTYR